MGKMDVCVGAQRSRMGHKRRIDFDFQWHYPILLAVLNI